MSRIVRSEQSPVHLILRRAVASEPVDFVAGAVARMGTVERTVIDRSDGHPVGWSDDGRCGPVSGLSVSAEMIRPEGVCTSEPNPTDARCRAKNGNHGRSDSHEMGWGMKWVVAPSWPDILRASVPGSLR